MKRTKKGFTLVELLVVIAILAILASVSVVGYTAFIDKAEESNANTLLAQVADYIYAEEISKPDYAVSIADEAELDAYLTAMGLDTTTVAAISLKTGTTDTLVYEYETGKTVELKIGA